MRWAEHAAHGKDEKYKILVEEPGGKW